LLCLKVSRASCFRLSDNNGVEMKMSMEQRWNDTGEKRSTGRRTCLSGTLPAEVILGCVFLKVFRLPCVSVPKHVAVTRKMQNYIRSALQSPRQCTHVLLVKVVWKQVGASRIEGGIMLRVEYWGYAGEERS
jgi:hypothetical protein